GMIDKVNKDVVSFLFKGELPSGNTEEIQEARNVRRSKETLKTTKEEIPNSDELAAQNRAAGQTQGGRPQVTETIIRDRPKIGRNDRVTIKNVMSGESKTIKYKQAEPLLDKGEWVLIED
ncbi:MAG: preprotein translocase subunit SecA, partial [Flavobacteriaceae bacterium]|nr:preprotein translocase subunit SecA [Flavobacteriaceae bacterium]